MTEHKKVEDLFPGLYDKEIFSGYLPTDVSGNELFYIFTPSQNNPTKDPVLLWLNGGPGCSSLFGWLVEIGPVVTELYSNKWTKNPFSWNKNLNVIYIEQPAGVGFSKTVNESQLWTEEKTAKGTYTALKHFFQNEFPEYQKLDFYISGESYAGVYIPNLIEQIVNDKEGNSIINLKGALIGNGLTFFDTDGEPSAVEFAYGHGLISLELYQSFLKHCYHLDPEVVGDWPIHNVTHKCNEIRQTVQDNLKGLDIYGILRPCRMKNRESNEDEKRHGMSYKSKIDNLMKEVNKKSKVKPLQWGEPDEEEIEVLRSWCQDDFTVDDFLNDPKNREKLGIDMKKTWGQCDGVNYPVNDSFDFFKNKIPKLPTGIRIWFFSGDLDGRIPTLGSMRWIDQLGFKNIEKFRQWKVGRQVAGYIEKYEYDFAFVTVTGAGHMVPQDKREEGYTLLMGFVKGEL